MTDTREALAKALPEYARVRDEFRCVEAIGRRGGTACLESAMLNVDALLRAALSSLEADSTDTPDSLGDRLP